MFCGDLTSDSVGNVRATTLSVISLLTPTGQLCLGWRMGRGEFRGLIAGLSQCG